MPEPVVCLGCGGLLREDGGPVRDLPAESSACSCPATPSEVEARTVSCGGCGGSLRVGARACPYCHVAIASQRCGACAAWNLADAKHCQACAGPLGASRRAQRSTGGCPRCQSPLIPRIYAEFDLDECDRCGGLFVEAEELDRIVSGRDSLRVSGLHLALPKRPRPAEEHVQYLPCPQCEQLMNRQMFGRISGVVVDACKGHGVWFDPGELTAVLDFVERGGLEEARRREDLRRREEARASVAPSSGPSSLAGASLEDAHPTWGAFAGALVEVWRAIVIR